jgi:hypothetical protein
MSELSKYHYNVIWSAIYYMCMVFIVIIFYLYVTYINDVHQWSAVEHLHEVCLMSWYTHNCTWTALTGATSKKIWCAEFLCLWPTLELSKYHYKTILSAIYGIGIVIMFNLYVMYINDVYAVSDSKLYCNHTWTVMTLATSETRCLLALN